MLTSYVSTRIGVKNIPRQPPPKRHHFRICLRSLSAIISPHFGIQVDREDVESKKHLCLHQIH